MPNRLIREVIRERGCTSVNLDASTFEAARLMLHQQISAVVVVDTTNALVGILSERDVVFDVVAKGLDPRKTLVGSVMTRHPRTITADRPLGHALHMMYEGGFRHIPVVDFDGRPIGMVAARDALGLDALQFEHELERREEITVIL